MQTTKFNSFPKSFNFQLFVLLALALGLNFNTLQNQYALDDYVVLTENKFVQKGISGIPDIIGNDLMSGTTDRNLLNQSRYRPFSLIIFALEHQFFGDKPSISHLINVLLFAMLIVVLYLLLSKQLLREYPASLSFITCLLFVTHPIHTEVIANVKSRDELIAFLLLLTSLSTFLAYSVNRSVIKLAFALMTYFLALLTRESAVTFILIYPLVLYFFYRKTLSDSLRNSFPFLIVLTLFFILRFAVIDSSKPVIADILNAPFLFATASQAFATKIYILLRYISILFYPYPLSCDYSYKQIPYIGPGTPEFLIAATILIALFIISIVLFRKRSVYSFSILFYFITISIASNLLIDIGTPFSERLLFQPSLAFCIVLGGGFSRYYPNYKILTLSLLFGVLSAFSVKTILRNTDWKNNETLFLKDADSSPNSARTTWAACEIYRTKAEKEQDEVLRNKLLDQSIIYGERCIGIYPDYATAYISLGFPYYYKGNLDKAAELWLKSYQLDSISPQARICMNVLSKDYYNRGNLLTEKGQTREAIMNYSKATDLNPQFTEAWYYLGGLQYLEGDSLSAEKSWERVKQLDPQYPLNLNFFLMR